jgi:hypothetical protein
MLCHNCAAAASGHTLVPVWLMQSARATTIACEVDHPQHILLQSGTQPAKAATSQQHTALQCACARVHSLQDADQLNIKHQGLIYHALVAKHKAQSALALRDGVHMDVSVWQGVSGCPCETTACADTALDARTENVVGRGPCLRKSLSGYPSSTGTTMRRTPPTCMHRVCMCKCHVLNAAAAVLT